ncbi:hypothetical protein LOTGIDRAFT_229555 [Lottia gigantea]|uniref:Cadherin domain-containing protein n=1 Tax=Lottia gigantea TaxID=225164 RepID=V3Z0K9_LOTGI|nr:hypothetical protein LOTGIDRAFT_229555 [Lottia gigantea]ESO84013.1 hypothetical protein LOTGIDRAFT_229555 [Lottia gigantea]
MSVTTVNINVPVNHRPWMTISKHDITLPEDIEVGHQIVNIKAKDKDKNQILTYHLKEQLTVPFQINPETGWLVVKAPLDREMREFYTLHVIVKDNGEPILTGNAVVKIRIEDINDHFPRFHGGNVFQGFVHENEKNDRSPQRVNLERNITVTDDDATPANRRVKLYLHGLGSQLFKLNSKTGQLTTSKIANIDREIHDFFHFKVMAVDSGIPSKTSTGTILISVVDVNDNHPKFLSTSFEFDVAEDIKPGGVIGRALAVDKDATQPNNLLLYLLENEMSGKFRLDINTGTIHVSEGFFSQPLKPVYKFNVTARDLGFPAGLTTTEVTLKMPNTEFTLQDIKKPKQRVMVLPEEIPIGSIIGRLEPELEHPVQDIRVDPAQKQTVPFDVKPNGAIITTDRIDRETGKPYYNFKILTLYNCTPPINTVRDVTAIVNDVNDNAPVFPLEQYTSTISKDFPKDTVIATPIAFDEVDERPSSYSYSITGPQPEYLTINKTTGIVRTTGLVKNITTPQIVSYTVTARDNQNPTLHARTKLNLHIMSHNITKDNC